MPPNDRVPLTTLEQQVTPTQSLPTLVSHVAEITDLSPNLREIVLEGGLEDFVSRGGDQFVYLMVRRPGGAQVPADHTMAAQLDTKPGTGPIAAYYTVRSWDARIRRLTFWMVRHGHHDGVGGWVGRCEIGERVALWGPRAGFGMRPRPTSWLFVADESGLAAVGALLDELPTRVSAQVIVETVDADHVIDLPARNGVAVTWLHRGNDEAGTNPRLLSAVRSLHLDDNPRHLIAFGAGESKQMTQIRKYLRHSIGIAADNVSITGYWRRKQPN
jgi:NADPH-dependent ferric siderophore reductase